MTFVGIRDNASYTEFTSEYNTKFPSIKITMSSSKLIVVTGANRGIGKAICATLLSHPSLPSVTLYATSRAGEDLGLESSSKHEIHYPSLDITSSNSISALVDEIKSLNQPLDILINNAGVNLDDQFSASNAKKTLDTNYRGTLSVCRAFLPLMTPDTGRIVNLSSIGSSLDPFGKETATRYRTVSSLSDLESFMREYEVAVEKGNETDLGFPPQRAYSVSKAAVNSFTAILAREKSNIAINCCCPGWVNTDMGNQVGKPPKTPEQGAKIPVRLAVGDLGGVSGRYWANDSIRGTGEGKVQEW